MSSDDIAKALKKVVAKAKPSDLEEGVPLGETPPPPRVDEGDADLDGGVHEFVYAFLLWEATPADASRAMKKIRDELADLNELRVCFEDEIVALLGVRYPRAAERCARLRLGLNEIFSREQALRLDHLVDAPKREARAYLESLPGVVPFVSARVVLLHLSAHAFPIDERLTQFLADEGVVEGAEPAVESAKLERAVRAGEARDLYLALERVVSSAPKTKSKRGGSAKSSRKAASAGGGKRGRGG